MKVIYELERINFSEYAFALLKHILIFSFLSNYYFSKYNSFAHFKCVFLKGIALEVTSLLSLSAAGNLAPFVLFLGCACFHLALTKLQTHYIGCRTNSYKKRTHRKITATREGCSHLTTWHPAK
jgi:hypothetical protein